MLQRLNCRGEDSQEVIDLRMKNAKSKLRRRQYFDFVVINALFESALFDLKAIVHAQRLKYLLNVRNKSTVFCALNLV